MKRKQLTKLIQDMAEVIRFHELEAVDSKAAEVLMIADTTRDEVPDEDIGDWIEQIHQANMHEMT